MEAKYMSICLAFNVYTANKHFQSFILVLFI